MYDNSHFSPTILLKLFSLTILQPLPLNFPRKIVDKMNTYLLTAILAPLFIFATSQALTTLGIVMKNQLAEYYGRSLASFLALVLCATYGTIASFLLNIAGYGGLGQWTTARSFKWTMWIFTGVWFDIEFEDDKDWLNTTRPAVFVGNHQTELDVLFLAHVFPKYCSVTAKSSLKWVPFLGWFSEYLISLSRE